jgi:hypothetical protein
MVAQWSCGTPLPLLVVFANNIRMRSRTKLFKEAEVFNIYCKAKQWKRL